MSRVDPIVFVLDDDISVRESLRNLFRSVGLKVETFGTAQEFQACERPPRPGCLVLDVRLPSLSGLDLQRQLADTHREVPIVFITGHGDIPMSVRAMKAGAIDFLTKPFRDQELLEAVRQGIDRDRQARSRETEVAELQKRHTSLTAREKEVMKYVVLGLANKQIATKLGITEPTVKLHRGRLMHKMGAESLADLIRMAQKVGALDV